MPEMNQLTLATAGEGAAEDLFKRALKRTLDNMDDLNTDFKTKRVVTLTFTFTTDESRRKDVVSIACKTKLAEVKPVVVDVFVRRVKGELTAFEPYTQVEMPLETAGRPEAVVTGGAS